MARELPECMAKYGRGDKIRTSRYFRRAFVIVFQVPKAAKPSGATLEYQSSCGHRELFLHKARSHENRFPARTRPASSSHVWPRPAKPILTVFPVAGTSRAPALLPASRAVSRARRADVQSAGHPMHLAAMFARFALMTCTAPFFTFCCGVRTSIKNRCIALSLQPLRHEYS